VGHLVFTEMVSDIVDKSVLESMYKQFQDTLAKQRAHANAIGTQVALGGGSLPGAPKSPTPKTIQEAMQQGGSSVATPQTENRRANPEIVRICDLAPGDKLAYTREPNTKGVVMIDPDNPSIISVSWGDNNWASRAPNWDRDMSDTTLIKNWIAGNDGAIFDPTNPVKVEMPPKPKTGVDFDSVILPADKKKEITDAISQVDNHDLIFNQWGFADVFEKGTAISLLFYGPPGTGKTLMAQAIADKYKYKLEIITTAEIETPEPGGAERNLKEYFQKAVKNNLLLLFDECDSLITDRHRVGMILAAQINALLTELERFKGMVIFTTNRLGALDPAFERRLSLKLEFPLPDKKHRVQIWKRMFPERAPLAPDIRWEDLASIEIAGGHIKNIVLKAARMAAAQKLTQITDEVLWEAMEKEIEAMEAYHEELANNKQWYGTPATTADLKRVRGKTQI
jgi:ATPase family associated with various cellular activities (AAA)